MINCYFSVVYMLLVEINQHLNLLLQILSSASKNLIFHKNILIMVISGTKKEEKLHMLIFCVLTGQWPRWMFDHSSSKYNYCYVDDATKESLSCFSSGIATGNTLLSNIEEMRMADSIKCEKHCSHHFLDYLPMLYNSPLTLWSDRYA